MVHKLYKILSIPALLFHELSHIFMILVLGVKGQGIDINNNEEDFEIVIHYFTENNLKKNMVSLAPLLGLAVWLLSIFITSGVIPFILFSYLILFLKVFLPSEHDVEVFNENLDSKVDIPQYYK